MAELVVGPLLSLVKDKACSYLLDQYKVMQGMEKERKILERKLPAILDIIQDAEEKGAFRPGVAAWLKDLKTVAYEANNAFDEFNYEALRREANKKGHHSNLGMDVVTARNPIVFRYRMGKKLRKIVQNIEVLMTEMNTFGFRHLQQAPPSKHWRKTDSILIDSEKEIVSRSREREKNIIVGMLLHEATNMDLMVLPVVGMGGLGKTTFAQLIYNDPAIEKHFQIRRWCCISDDFDAAKIASNISQTNFNDQDSEQAFKKLLKMITGWRCLIILDDVWNRDEAKWGKLLTCLKKCGKGSAVLTTTRDAEVARIMKMGVAQAYNIEKLSTKHLKQIVQSRAFSLQKPNSDELDGIMDMIVNRCTGSPLAAKAFGSMLSTRTSLNEWKDIAAKGSICNEGTGILPILKLSFDDLTSHMKQCFAFCAIFPKDYVIDVELLIQLWMAHDFIPLDEDQHPETVGQEIFKELTWRSFFEVVQQTSLEDSELLNLRKGTMCKTHDLMHDIALSVMGTEGATIVDTRSLKLLPNNPASHFFISHFNVAAMDKFSKKQSATVRTLFSTEYSPFRHISKCISLRALHLPRPVHGVKVSHMQHLRYLNLSGNSELKGFPEDISIMYNLQTLNVSYCKRLCQLPKDMKYMASLRHLYTTGCKSLTCMPPGLGQITSLRTLTYFVVSARSGCSTIGELQNINLGGELELNCLENATEELAKAANLKNKEKLTHLALQWNSEGQEELVQDFHKKVLYALKPHGGLQMLRIVNYKGNSLPLWMTDVNMMQHLTELRLLGCMFTEEFPQFGHLKALQVLFLEKLNKLRCLSTDMASMPFPALKEVQLHDLEVFETWTEGKEGEITFPKLEVIDVRNCPKLISIPYSPKLKVMRLNECRALLSLAVLKSRQISSLSELQLHVSDTEAAPPQVDENQESSLSELYLNGSHFFFSSSQKFAAWNWFNKLVSLKIVGCETLINWPEDVLQGLVSLKNLGIYCCNNLIGPTRVNDSESTQTMHEIQPYLNMLEIASCASFEELPMLPVSRIITIYDCPKLEALWGKEVEPPETLESLCLMHCGSLVAIPKLPSSLKDLQLNSCRALRSMSGNLDALQWLCIRRCNELHSLDSMGELPSLARIEFENCKNLALPVGGRYLALRHLKIRYCPAIDMKGFYKCHQQHLESLEVKDLSHAHSSDPDEGPKLREPNTWLYAFPQFRGWVIRRHINSIEEQVVVNGGS